MKNEVVVLMGQNGKADPAPIVAANTSVRGLAVALCGAVLLTACSASAQNSMSNSMPLDGQSDAPPQQHSVAYSAPHAGEMAGTGTAVGQKIQQLRGGLSTLEGNVSAQSSQLDSLRGSARASAADYYAATAAIEAKLQVGTTRGNPILVAQMSEAEGKLAALSQDLGDYNNLSTAAATSASQAAFLLQSIRATYGLSGAVDEDHVALGALEDDANRAVVKIDRLLNNVSSDLSRQTAYVATERRNLQTLALAVDNGEMYGQSLANRPFVSAGLSASRAGPGSNAAPQSGAPASGGRPLVVIRFTQDNVDYQGAVYQAVSQALDRYPQASFTIMAVSPTGANAADGALATSDAERNADGVARTLSQMGVASSRIQLSQASSAGIASTEVRIYVR